jgi:hypothetical protein
VPDDNNMTRIDFILIARWLFGCAWVVLFVGGLFQYAESKLIYTAFSIVFLVMLISGFHRQISYSYLFLVIMLWLGFWFKLTLHLLLDYPYVEPVGMFYLVQSKWDDILIIASIGSVGVLMARLLCGFLGLSNSMVFKGSNFTVPLWYPKVRKWIWGMVMLGCICLAIVNAVLVIFQVGLVPQTILPWPLNAVISWLLGFGVVMVIGTLLWWDIVMGRKISLVVYIVLLEGVVFGVSILSRKLYVFHVIPVFLGMFYNRHLIPRWSRKNTLAVCVVFLGFLMITNPLINLLRNHYYSGAPIELTSVWPSNYLSKFARFAADRWIGLEGLMAVSANPNKGDELFMHALTERREIGEILSYQEISKSHYRFVDQTKFQFGSSMGPTAFFYLSGKKWLVLLGMIILTFLMLVSERLIFYVTSNPILCGLWGGYASLTVSSFGTAPRSLIITLFEMAFGFAVIWFVQSNYFSKFLIYCNRVIVNIKQGIDV